MPPSKHRPFILQYLPSFQREWFWRGWEHLSPKEQSLFTTIDNLNWRVHIDHIDKPHSGGWVFSRTYVTQTTNGVTTMIMEENTRSALDLLVEIFPEFPTHQSGLLAESFFWGILHRTVPLYFTRGGISGALYVGPTARDLKFTVPENLYHDMSYLLPTDSQRVLSLLGIVKHSTVEEFRASEA